MYENEKESVGVILKALIQRNKKGHFIKVPFETKIIYKLRSCLKHVDRVSD